MTLCHDFLARFYHAISLTLFSLFPNFNSYAAKYVYYIHTAVTI